MLVTAIIMYHTSNVLYLTVELIPARNW